MRKIYEYNVPEAVDLVNRTTKIADIERLKSEEISSPNFPGGRSSVLLAINKQIGRILASVSTPRFRPGARIIYRAVVGNLHDDRGNRISKGSEVVGLSRKRLDYYIEIGGIIEETI